MSALRRRRQRRPIDLVLAADAALSGSWMGTLLAPS